MGLRRLSMSPAFVPSIKEALRHLTLGAARESAERVLRMATAAEVRGYLTGRVRELWPGMTLLDMHE
jgi:phosphoenolpyruvate-protein kinase (PTS system EI component)